MKTTKILFAFGILALFTLLATSFTSAQITTCNPVIKLVNQDPNPAIPNDYVKVVFEVSSLNNCKGYTIELDPQYPFSLDPGTNPIQTIADAPYVTDYKSAWDVPYKIRIANDALEGEYELKLKYHEGSDSNIQFNTIEKGFNISIVDSQTDFATVIQESSSGQVSLGIVNTGKNTANSLIVKIPNQEGYRTTGSSEQILGNLAAGDYTLVSFTLSPKMTRNGTRTTPGSQTAPSENIQAPQNTPLIVQIDYTDGIGRRRSVTKQIEYNIASSGNFTALRTGLNSRNTTTTSGTTFLGYSIWWYVVGVILIIAGYYFYKRNKDKKTYNSHNGSGKNSSTDPDWVSSERTHRKK